jgi:predicted DNA-binding ribbon-helix-helix protein
MPGKADHRGKPSANARRTVKICGQTSVSLEDPFWDAMQEIAEAKDTSRAELIREINQTRSNANLSSAIRLFVLAYYQGSGR